MFESKTKTKTYRMYLRSYKRIRKAYPGLKDETMADYFERVSKEI